MEKNTGLIRMNIYSLPQRRNPIEEKFSCVYGGIIAVLFILRF